MKKNILLGALFFLILVFPCFSDEKTVFVVESYHVEYPWDISYKQGIESILAPKYSLVYFQMDTKRLPADQFEHRAQLAFEMYRKIDPVLVILGDDNALKFLGPKFSKTQTPVVYLGINNNPRDYHVANIKNITGILERPVTLPAIVYVKDIVKPKPDKILILFDSGISSRSAIQVLFSNRDSATISGLKIDLKLIGQLPDWEKTVLNAKENGYGAIILGLYHTIVDENGTHVNNTTIINWTSRHTPVPCFGFWDFSVGPDKIIGGLVISGFSQGEAAAKMALEILEGKKSTQILPVKEKKNQFLFSRTQLKKWQIHLPEHIASKAAYTD